ncbi:MAG: YfhO family protein [Bacteroidales bacterium]
MNKSTFKTKILPYILIIVGFIVLAYAYTPYVLQSKIVNQTDISHWQGMANEIVQWNNIHPDDPALWTGSMFSGMPANAIQMEYKGDLTKYLYNFFLLGSRPASYLLISLIGAFLLFLAFGSNLYVSAIGAIAVTFCSYNMQIIQVGHNTKMQAIAFMPYVLAAIVYSYRQKNIWKILLGAIFFALALSLQIKANHPQITYYLAIMVLGYAIAEFCGAINHKGLQDFFKISVFLLVFGLVGIGTNANQLIPTYEYQQYTMRGGSILSNVDDSANKINDGLDIDYATAWSYGIEEMPNLIIPNFNGGSSSSELSKSSDSYQVLRKYQSPNKIIKNMPTYWGPQPFTAGPMYIGIIMFFLFILGLFLIKGRKKWWVLGISLMAIFLAWGSHFMWFSKIFFNYAPLYNKFRTVSMALVILQITIPIMAVLGLDKLIKTDRKDPKVFNAVKWSGFVMAIILGILLVIIQLLPLDAFSSATDIQLPKDLVNALQADRRSLALADWNRSFIFSMIFYVVLYWLYFAKKKPLKLNYFLGIVAIFVICDYWSVDKRYLNESNFVSSRQFNAQFQENPVDKIINGDNAKSYRVLDLSVNTFNNANTSYHHKTIGGYSAAKLQRYQDLISYYISPEMTKMRKDLQETSKNAKTIEDLQAGLEYYPILAMLNTKYIIFNPNTTPLTYDKALGNAWFVEKIVGANSSVQEIEFLKMLDPANIAVVPNKSFMEDLNIQSIALRPRPIDTASLVNMTFYSPNELRYFTKSKTGGLVVFSEIYYPAGWTASIDGKKAKIVRADYALRSLYVPAGQHQIVFKYAPASIKIGEISSRISSIILLIFILLLIVKFSYYCEYGKRKNNTIGHTVD